MFRSAFKSLFSITPPPVLSVPSPVPFRSKVCFLGKVPNFVAQCEKRGGGGFERVYWAGWISHGTFGRVSGRNIGLITGTVLTLVLNLLPLLCAHVVTTRIV